MADFKNFDPNQYFLSFAGILVRGFVSDTFIAAVRNEDSFSMAVGAQGDVVRVRSNDRSGLVTVTLQAESPTNDEFSDYIVADELAIGGTLPGALLLKNGNGTTFISAENAWLMKPADVEVGTDASPREWVIACAELNMFVGGAIL